MAQLAEIKRRAGDYDVTDFLKERERLIAAWRAAHPEAANQPPSAGHRPLVFKDKNEGRDPLEIWISDIYHVTLRRKPDHVFNKPEGMIQLGINAIDGTARHDWREFQWIKNQLAGEECEAFELYPAESRLLDPSNYYSLFCFPGIKRIKVGLEERRVWDASEAWAPQRGFSE
jgi:hypothetical protein